MFLCFYNIIYHYLSDSKPLNKNKMIIVGYINLMVDFLNNFKA